jgi:Ca2+-binding EF-hand superfamily protein
MKYSLILLAGMFPLAAHALAAPPAKPQAADEDVQDLVFLSDSRPVLIRLHIRLDGKPLLAVWNSFINEMFDKLDTNKDGVLDRAEAARMPSPQEIFVNIGGNFFRGFGGGGFPANVETDGDGKITRARFAEYFRKNGGAPFQLAQAGDAMNTYYRRIALDATGTLPTPGQADALNKILFNLLDTNKDGKLSRKELEAAPAILLKKDADDDEMVTAAELQGQTTSNMGYQVLIDGDMTAPLSAEGPLVAVNARESNRNLARQLLNRYARSAEAKKAGKLTAKDLGLNAEAFRKLDVDEDGKLDAEELARFARRDPDVEIDISIGKPASVVIRPLRGKDPGMAVHKEKDGTVSVAIGNTILHLRLDGNGNGWMTGFRAVPVDDDAFIKMQFAAADADNNGYLDMTEARRNGYFANSFKAMDADGDGKLYLKEVLAYNARQKELRAKAAASCVTVTMSDQGKGLFDLLDTNGDGRLSVREMRAAVKLIDRLDRDGDGCISVNEIPRRYSLTAKRGGSGGGNFSRAVVAFAPGMQPSGPRPEPSAGPLWFRKMDRNRDGDVSRREFLGTDEQFREIDTDGDGLISVKEAEAYDAKMRKKKQ